MDKEYVIALTDAKLRALKPRNKPYKVADFDGLYVNVTVKGGKLWRFKYRFAGIERLLAFGAYPIIGLKSARNLRDEAKTNIANGIDPSNLKRKQKQGMYDNARNTFTAASAGFLSKKIKEGRAPATLHKIEWLLAMANADFGKLPLSEISTRMILITIKKRENLGHYETAKKLRSTIGGVFRFAIASGLVDNDPTFALKGALISPTVTHRAAITDKAVFGGLLRAINRYHGQVTTRIALCLLILTATRPGELRLAQWDEFDIEQRVWNVPAIRMKMRKPHMVPLSKPALDLLEELRAHTGHGAFLFPSNGSCKKQISENTFNQALRRMGYGSDQVTAHGFRATFSTFANESGLWHPDAIERALAHVERNEIRRAYDRGQHWDERVKLADWWGEELEGMKGRNIK
ncbi:MAG: tyrosine-type recombinase/integrase [Robiginitomaculum sp.]|nr:tyrosine-type recombinase/integrase [Robiginitomaculum sp.]